MNLLHPHHHQHWVPFDDDDRADPVGDRRALKVEVGRLRRELAARDQQIAALEGELRRLAHQASRRWWQR